MLPLLTVQDVLEGCNEKRTAWVEASGHTTIPITGANASIALYRILERGQDEDGS